MFWADRISDEIQNRKGGKSTLIVRDEKTLSGRVHIGSMRGVAIHGLVSETLSELGVSNKYLYELNDFDPFDSNNIYPNYKTNNNLFFSLKRKFAKWLSGA